MLGCGDAIAVLGDDGMGCDSAALLPEVPLNIKSGTRVRIIVESLLPDEKPKPKTFLQTAKSLNLQGKPDWSTNIDQYLHEENISENE